MAEDEDASRRRILTLAGATAATVAVAGCVDDADTDDGDEDTETDDGDEDDTAVDDEDDTVVDDGDEDDTAADEDEPGVIDPGEQIVLEGNTGGFVGLEPSSIEGKENPTLVLEEGETYEIGWTQGDGQAHNVVIWDADENLVEDYYTGNDGQHVTDDPGDGDFLEFEASEETVYYRCFPHAAMQGEIQLDPPAGGEDEAADREQFEIEPETRIELDGQTAGWVGGSPSMIEGEENPSLVLEADAEYEIGWTEGDGVPHNVEIRNADDDVVDDLETELSQEGGNDQFLAFVASEEMDSYVCAPHETSMNGDLNVE